MKQVPVQEAVGMVLCHDITRIVPGQSKGPAFRKGRIIEPEDIPRLLDLGKQHLYVFDLAEGQVHENEAALRIARAAAGNGLTLTEPVEGKVNLVAAGIGLLKIKVDALYQINSIEEIIFSTLHTNQPVSAGRPVAGTRIIPLVTGEEKLAAVEAICRAHRPIVSIKPFAALRVGIVTTGSEVYHGRIQDKFGPVVQAKFAELGSTVMRQVFVSDEVEMTVRAIHELLADGAEMIAVTGGMSVDPDDQTPASIRAAGGRVVTYGAPVLPGAMFMLATIGNVPVLGLPGCVMYHKASIFDLVVPRILAGETVTRADIVAMGHGGFCAACDPCRFPNCAFGK
jgi:molybdenum cofactor synthesis domain-containing protein